MNKQSANFLYWHWKGLNYMYRNGQTLDYLSYIQCVLNKCHRETHLRPANRPPVKKKLQWCFTCYYTYLLQQTFIIFFFILRSWLTRLPPLFIHFTPFHFSPYAIYTFHLLLFLYLNRPPIIFGYPQPNCSWKQLVICYGLFRDKKEQARWKKFIYSEFSFMLCLFSIL